jgi:hypothetical protein
MRTTREVKYLRYDFDSAEKLAMGNTLATNHNTLADLKAQEEVFKAQMKEKKTGIELSIQGLSRALYTGYEMRNIDCTVRWDSPNVNEVEYIRMDTGEVAITRPMTEQECQQEFEFGKMVEAEAGKLVPFDASAENIGTFFGKPRLAPEPEFQLVQESENIDDATAEDAGNSAVVDAEAEDDDVLTSSDPDDAKEATKPEHDALFAEPKKGRGRPKGSTNKAKDEDEPF